MHTTPSNYDYDDVPDLPSYSDSEVAAAVPKTTPLPSEDPPRDEYTVVQPPVHTGWRVNGRHNGPVNIKETTIRMDERLNNPEAHFQYITNYLSAVPPKPAVRTQGWHYETLHRKEKKETERVVDFDITLYLTDYLPSAKYVDGQMAAQELWRPHVAFDGDRVHRGSWRKTRAQGYKPDVEAGSEPRKDLLYWCKDYCESKAKLKIFRVTRNVIGLDEVYLRERIEHHIRSTNYRGHIQISFPIEEKHVDIYSPHIVNKWRISWVRYIFYLTFLWIITWPILFFATKWWTVYNVGWCFSLVTTERREDGMVRPVKKYASITEQAWLAKHAGMIKALALEGFQGDATSLPLDMASRSEDGGGGSMPETGNANVDSAVNFIQGGVNVWNAVSRGTGRGVNGWGVDC